MQVATKIRNGESYIERDFRGIRNFGTKSDYSFISVEQEQSLGYVVNIFTTLLKNGTPIEEIIALTALNKGTYGTIAINKLLQQAVNPPSENKAEIKFGDNIFRVGDRVMQIRNNYSAKLYMTDEEFEEYKRNMYVDPVDDEEEYEDNDYYYDDEDDEEDDDEDEIDKDSLTTVIFNGNIGTVIDIIDNKLIVQFDDRKIIYAKEELIQLLLGYCITYTSHKVLHLNTLY
jgi:ATP-dependent exoDNAse (exonuclease V) alpha subunit